MGHQRKELAERSRLDAVIQGKGLNLFQVAALSGVAFNTVKRIREGQPVRHTSLLAVANYLEVKPAEIYPVDRL